jgi:hypothetical protein
MSKKKNRKGSNKTYVARMENWQELILNNFAQRKRTISEDELEVAAKSTLARIIFLQTCERGFLLEKGALQGILYPRRDENEDYECEPLCVQRSRLAWESRNRTVQQRLFRLFDYAYRWNSKQFASFLKSHKIKIPETAFFEVSPKLKLDDGALRKIIEEVINL